MNFNAFLSSVDFLFKINFFQNILSEIPSVSNSLDPDQDGCSVGPDLGLNVCIGYQQIIGADQTAWTRQLVCSLVVPVQQNQVFFKHGPYYTVNSKIFTRV